MKQLPCGKLISWASSVEPVNVNAASREGRQIFSPGGCVLCVLQQLVWHRTQNPLGKTHHPNVSQTRLSLDSAEGLRSPLEHSLMRRWHSSLLLFWGCHGGVQLVIFFFCGDDSSEAAPGASSSPWQIAVKIWGFRGGRDRNVKTKDNETHLEGKRKSVEGLAGHFVPSAASLENVPLTLLRFLSLGLSH